MGGGNKSILNIDVDESNDKGEIEGEIDGDGGDDNTESRPTIHIDRDLRNFPSGYSLPPPPPPPPLPPSPVYSLSEFSLTEDDDISADDIRNDGEKTQREKVLNMLMGDDSNEDYEDTVASPPTEQSMNEIDKNKHNNGKRRETEDELSKIIDVNGKGIYNTVGTANIYHSIENEGKYCTRSALLNQVKRIQVISEKIGYPLYIIQGNTVTVPDGGDLYIFNLSHDEDREYSVGMAMKFKKYIRDIETVHSILPNYNSKICEVVSNTFDHNVKEVDRHVSDMRTNHAYLLSIAKQKIKRAAGVIVRCDHMLDELTSTIKIERSGMKMKREKWAEEREFTPEHENIITTYNEKMTQLLGKRKVTSETKGRLQNEIDRIILTFDDVVFTNLVISRAFLDNQEKLRVFVNSLS